MKTYRVIVNPSNGAVALNLFVKARHKDEAMDQALLETGHTYQTVDLIRVMDVPHD